MAVWTGGVYLILLIDHNLNKAESVNIREIITDKKLLVVFQPVISVSRKMVIGLEGLIRGINPSTNQIISPPALFKAAEEQGLTLELDRICRNSVIEAFSHIYCHNDNQLLFLNVDASILDRVEGSKYLLNQIKAWSIRPRNVVIEINESRTQDADALKRFTDTYRKSGFMVALDDVGTGFSNMDRILTVKPDMIKIDISLIKNINSDYFKQGIFKSLVNLSNNIGALVIAEGVETEEEAIEILRLGGHMIQGYWFAEPLAASEDASNLINNKIDGLIHNFNVYMKTKKKEEKQNSRQLFATVNNSIKELAVVPGQEFDKKLMEIIWKNKNIECAYILDEYGIQLSNTIRFCDENEGKDSLLFYAARLGTDHSMEKYYYPLMNSKVKQHITEPYISLATGNLCITVSKVFLNADGRKYILCMDFSDWGSSFSPDYISNAAMPNFSHNLNSEAFTGMNKFIKNMNEEIIKDSLTGAYNRRFMGHKLLLDISAAAQARQPISVVLADIDHFKYVNDQYGHLAGDCVLQEFVKLAGSKIRKNTDWIARYGGEEFLIVLIDTDRNIAFKVAEKIRRAIERTPILYNHYRINITASFGTYTIVSEKISCEQLIDYADKNLYIAKNSGRNKTID